MSAPPLQPTAASIEQKNREFARELRKIENRDWWVWGYSIFVIVLLAFTVISFLLQSLGEGADTRFKIKASDAIFGLVALVIIFDVYVVYQQTLIKRLRRQLAEKQGHSDLLRTLAMIDPLTGLYNRRFAEQRLAAEVARSERKGHPLTVLTLDLDHFKQVNDTHGHPAGDLVLQEFAARLNKIIRGSDLAVRLGGDEFLVAAARACAGASWLIGSGLAWPENSRHVFGGMEAVRNGRAAGGNARARGSSAL